MALLSRPIDLSMIPSRGRSISSPEWPDYRETNALLVKNLNQFVPLRGSFITGRHACVHGDERWTLNPARDDQHCGSFSINQTTGAWRDLATGKSGGALDLFAEVLGTTLLEAARRAIQEFGSSSGMCHQNCEGAPPLTRLDRNGVRPVSLAEQMNRPSWRAISGTPSPFFFNRSRLEMTPKATFLYFLDSGELAFAVGRFEPTWGIKFFQFVYWSSNNCWETGEPSEFKGRRPIYNLLRLLGRPELPVILVEGEKKCDALQEHLTNHVVVTWAGGAGAWRHSDWRHLQGRMVIIWPDNDEAGRRAMSDLCEELSSNWNRVSCVEVPEDKFVGWDCKDSLETDPTGVEATYLVANAVEV